MEENRTLNKYWNEYDSSRYSYHAHENYLKLLKTKKDEIETFGVSFLVGGGIMSFAKPMSLRYAGYACLGATCIAGFFWNRNNSKMNMVKEEAVNYQVITKKFETLLLSLKSLKESDLNEKFEELVKTKKTVDARSLDRSELHLPYPSTLSGIKTESHYRQWDYTFKNMGIRSPFKLENTTSS